MRATASNSASQSEICFCSATWGGEAIPRSRRCCSTKSIEITSSSRKIEPAGRKASASVAKQTRELRRRRWQRTRRSNYNLNGQFRLLSRSLASSHLVRAVSRAESHPLFETAKRLQDDRKSERDTNSKSKIPVEIDNKQLEVEVRLSNGVQVGWSLGSSTLAGPSS